MSNVLSEAKKQQVIALGRLGWPLRRIEQETGVRRETAGAYLKAAGIAVRPPGAWGRRPPAKPANEDPVTTGSDAIKPTQTINPNRNPENLSTQGKAKAQGAKPANAVTTGFGVESTGLEVENPKRIPSASACEPFREAIELGLSRGRDATAIWQDLVAENGFDGAYQTVKRYVRKLRGNQPLQPRAVILTGPGEESQVDYGTGAMVRDPQSRKYRRTRLFVMVLGCSRKAARFLIFRSSSRIWAELHEKAFRRLGGVTRLVVLDNLREGVLTPDIYEPTLNPLYRDVLRSPLPGAQSATAAELAAGRSIDSPAHLVPRSHREQNPSGGPIMNVIELERALRQLRLGGMASVLETRLRQAQAEPMAPIDLISCLVSDELTRRSDRLLERRRKQAGFRDPDRTLDNFDFTFNPKMNRSLVFDLATGTFINKREDALFLGPGGTGKSHLAQAIGQAAIQQGYKVLYRETHILLDELAEAVADGTRKEYMESIATVPLLIVDDFGMRKLPHTAAEDLLEIIMRRYERFSTLLTSNRPVEDWGKLLGDVAAVSAMLDRLLHHGHVLKCGPRSWRTKTAPAP